MKVAARSQEGALATAAMNQTMDLIGIGISSSEVSKMKVLGSSVGAICGWIYWRIAIGRTSDADRAKDPA